MSPLGGDRNLVNDLKQGEGCWGPRKALCRAREHSWDKSSLRGWVRRGKRENGGIIIKRSLFRLMAVGVQGPNILPGGGPAGKASGKKTGTKGESILSAPSHKSHQIC